MKSIIVSSLVLLAGLSASADMAVRACPQNTLSCKLETAPYGAPRTLVDQVSNVAFDGTNQDEPSIAPDQCKIQVGLRDSKGNNILVTVEENGLMTNLSVSDKKYASVGSSSAFNATAGKAFYLGHDGSILTCTVSK
ncbi:hypothetical protein CIK05_09590 [Bdellovibrio sp. qaytius]|nr:hypothetical protein CIK05_09590 [Bdellovibrio sp. qaytius]